jgi:hypothetical protein
MFDRTVSLLLPLLVGLVFSVVWSTPAFAEGEQAVVRGPHRIQSNLGLEGTFTGFDEDGHWQDSTRGAMAGAGYGYNVLRWLELGAGARYFELGDAAGDWHPRMAQRALVPWLGVRVHTRSDEFPDLGLVSTLRQLLVLALARSRCPKSGQRRTHAPVEGHAGFAATGPAPLGIEATGARGRRRVDVRNWQ